MPGKRRADAMTNTAREPEQSHAPKLTDRQAIIAMLEFVHGSLEKDDPFAAQLVTMAIRHLHSDDVGERPTAMQN